MQISQWHLSREKFFIGSLFPLLLSEHRIKHKLQTKWVTKQQVLHCPGSNAKIPCLSESFALWTPEPKLPIQIRINNPSTFVS